MGISAAILPVRYISRDQKAKGIIMNTASTACLPSSSVSQASGSRSKSHLRASRQAAKQTFLKREGDSKGKDEVKWAGQRLFPSRKLLVLDLDETLVHSTSPPQDGQYRVTVNSAGTSMEIGVGLRPFVREFLSKASKLYEVVVFTSALADYANAVLDFVDCEGAVHHRLFRQHCVVVNGGVCKDLKMFTGVEMKDILICDNLVSNFRLQLDNGVPIKTWTGDKDDKELTYLMDYLAKMATVDDVREVNKQLFSLQTLFPNNPQTS